MKDSKKMLLADMALLIAALGWGGGFVAGDIAAEAFSPFFIMAMRFLGAAIWMLFLFAPHIRKSTKEDRRAGAILGGILCIGQPIQILGVKYTTPSKHAFLLAAYVVIVPFFSWIILKKKPQTKAFVAGILALIGIGLISLNEMNTVELGDALSLLFSVIYSFLIVITGILARKTDPLAMSFYQYLTTGVFSAMVVLLFEKFPNELPMLGLGALAYLILVNTVIAYTLQNVAQRYTTDTHAAVLISMESVFGYLCGVLLYGDPFTIRVLIGGLIMFSAVLLSVLNWENIINRRKVV